MILQNYSKITDKLEGLPSSKKFSGKWRKSWMILILPVWVVASFYIAQALLIGLIWLLNQFHVSTNFLNQSVFNAIVSALLYIITLILVGVIPLFIKHRHSNMSDIGLNRLPSWTDILITPAGLIIYLILSSVLMLVMKHFFTGINVNQAQNTGFSHLTQNYEYILAFITLVIIAPVAEETLFRGFLYGKLKAFMPFWAAILITSALFGAFHGQWDLAIDTFALSIVLCLLRETTGSLWASILLHMTKNGIAFYFLFINPILLTTLGK
jgi:membrane protease YdiL (CAAX protease family)